MLVFLVLHLLEIYVHYQIVNEHQPKDEFKVTPILIEFVMVLGSANVFVIVCMNIDFVCLQLHVWTWMTF